MDQKGSAAMLTSIQSAGVALEVNRRITQARNHARVPTWLCSPGETSLEVQNMGISGLTKRTNVLKNFKKNKTKRKPKKKKIHTFKDLMNHKQNVTVNLTDRQRDILKTIFQCVAFIFDIDVFLSEKVTN